MPKAKGGAEKTPDTDIFARLGLDDDAKERDEGADDGQEPGEEGKIAALEARLTAQQKELDRVSRTNTALMSTAPTFGVQPQGQGADGDPEISMEGLPDPVTDAQAYHRELSKRIAASIRAQTERDNEERRAMEAAEATRNARTDALWEEFAQGHPELAEQKDLVSVCAAQVVQKAINRGMDPDKYMFGASEQFFADVEGEVEKRFGKALKAMKAEKGKKGEEDEQDDGTPAHIREANRALGIQGGVSSGGQPGRGREEPRGDLVEDLHKVQRKLGLY